MLEIILITAPIGIGITAGYYLPLWAVIIVTVLSLWLAQILTKGSGQGRLIPNWIPNFIWSEAIIFNFAMWFTTILT